MPRELLVFMRITRASSKVLPHRNPSAEADFKEISHIEDSSKNDHKYKPLFHALLDKDSVEYDDPISYISKITTISQQILDIIAIVTSFAKTDKSLVKCQIGHTHFTAH